MEATKRPWTVQGRNIHHLQFDEPLDARNLVASVPNDNPESLANARLIVTAVNHFEEMVEALEGSLPLLVRLGDFIGNGSTEHPHSSLGERCDTILKIKEVLKRAKGE